MIRTSLSCLAAALLVACADGSGGKNDDVDTDVASDADEVVGLYRVTSEAQDDSCMENFVEKSAKIPFFRLIAAGDAADYYVCRDASDCDEFPDASRQLTRKRNGDWVNVSTWSQVYDGDANGKLCEFNQFLLKLTHNGDKYTLDGRKEQDTEQSPTFKNQASCDTALGDWSPSTSATASQCDRIKATKVE